MVDRRRLFHSVHAQHSETAVIGRCLSSGIAVRLASEAQASGLILLTHYDSIEALAIAPTRICL